MDVNKIYTAIEFAQKNPKNIYDPPFSPRHHLLVGGLVPERLRKVIETVLLQVQTFQNSPFKIGGCTIFYLISTDTHNRLLITGSGSGEDGMENEYINFLEQKKQLRQLNLQHENLSFELLPRIKARTCMTGYSQAQELSLGRNDSQQPEILKLIRFMSLPRILNFLRIHKDLTLLRINEHLAKKWLKIDPELNLMAALLENSEQDIEHFGFIYLQNEHIPDLSKMTQTNKRFQNIKNKMNQKPTQEIIDRVKTKMEKKYNEIDKSLLENCKHSATFQGFFGSFWNHLLAANVIELLCGFAHCAEDNLLEYLYIHPDTIDGTGNHIIFTVFNKENYNKKIELCPPCSQYCYWNFPRHYNNIGQIKLAIWQPESDVFKHNSELVSLLLNRDFEAFKSKFESMKDFKFAYGSTILHYAAHYHSCEQFVEFICENHPALMYEIDDGGDLPLHRAVLQGHFKVAQYLVKTQYRKQGEIKNAGMIDTPNIDHATPFSMAVLISHQEMIQLFLEPHIICDLDLSHQDAKAGFNILHLASSFSTLNVVEKVWEHMRKRKMNINSVAKNNSTALFFACHRGNYDIFNFLLKNGGDINIIVSVLPECYTMFLWSAFKNRFDLVQLLMNEFPSELKTFKGQAVEDNSTALHYAAMWGNFNDIKMLTDNSFLMNRDANGKTPYDVAVDKRRDVEILNHLKSYQGTRCVVEDEKWLKANNLKSLGNKAYSRKDFITSLSCYTKALSLNPLDMTYKLNIAAVYFEQKKFKDSIKTCLEAIEIGRENSADNKLISKAFARIAKSHAKLGEYTNAKAYFEKSLCEHPNPETRSMLAEVEKIIKERDRKGDIVI